MFSVSSFSVALLRFCSFASSYLAKMAKLQFYCCLVGADKTTIPVIQRVRRPDEDIWYGFPEDLQLAAQHTELIKLSTIKNAFTSMKTRGSFRNIMVTLSEELMKSYVDEDGNFVFNNHVLAEVYFTTPIPAPPDPTNGTRFDSMVACLEKIAAPKEESVKEILKHLLIEKFAAKNMNVEAWCSRFEKESQRFNLVGRRQIEVFKSCLDQSLSNWFIVTQQNLAVDAQWNQWRAEMVSTFGDHSFKPVCSAIGFRYLGGSLIDYIVNKEKMLIEANRELPKKVLLDLIVYGLPAHIIRSLNRNTVTSISILKDKLKKHEGGEKGSESSKFKNFSNKSNLPKNSSSSSSQNFDSKTFSNSSNVNNGKRSTFQTNVNNRKACSICLTKGHERFHPEVRCFYKDKPTVNKVEVETSSNNSSDEDSKN